MPNVKVKTDCCGNCDEFLIADEFGNGRVRVEGNCPMCGAEEPLGTIGIHSILEYRDGLQFQLE